jgi:glycosyltransferase involved in cell wall biosynthesis
LRKIKKNNQIRNNKQMLFDASIICPLYNEVDYINNKFIKFVKEIKASKKNYEILVVDNNSTDGTTQKLKRLKNKRIFKNITFIFNKENLGKGGSVKKACKISKGKYCCIFDIDEYFASDLLKGIDIAKKKSFDFLIGTRINEKNKYLYIYKANFYGVKFLTWLINILYGLKLTDAAAAIKIFNKKKYNSIKLNSSGFDFEFELICKFAKRQFSISEFYSNYKPRSFAEGKKLIAWKDGSKILIIILKTLF